MSRSNQQRLITISDRKYVMQFGRYKGESIQDILDNDPLYLVWLQENTDLDFHHELIEEAGNNGKPSHEFKGYTSRDFK